MSLNEGNSLECFSILHAKMQYLQNYPISSMQLKLGLLWHHNLLRNKGKQIITIYYSGNHLENSANISK